MAANQTDRDRDDHTLAHAHELLMRQCTVLFDVPPCPASQYLSTHRCCHRPPLTNDFRPKKLFLGHTCAVPGARVWPGTVTVRSTRPRLHYSPFWPLPGCAGTSPTNIAQLARHNAEAAHAGAPDPKRSNNHPDASGPTTPAAECTDWPKPSSVPTPWVHTQNVRGTPSNQAAPGCVWAYAGRCLHGEQRREH